MMKKERIYHDSDEKNTSGTIVYADADDGHVFWDSTKKQKIDKADLLNLFMKGMIVFLTDEYFKPVSYKEEGGAGKITVVHENSTAETLNFYSSEHGE